MFKRWLVRFLGLSLLVVLAWGCSSQPPTCESVSCGANEICEVGVCKACTITGEGVCDNKCVDLQTSALHCGACNKTCQTGEVCEKGTCTLSCQKEQTNCSGTCTDTQSHQKHCGACNNACKAGEICDSGTCKVTCASDQTSCSGECVDLKRDGKNCGKCGVACSDGQVCQDGSCACPTGQTECSGTCTNPNTDPKHCGACGTACSQGEVCSTGKCGVYCKSGETNCSGSCISIQTDAKNCGGCGKACPNGATCQKGVCSCPQGQEVCGDTCVDVQTDSKHCGACNLGCTNGTTCCAGSCLDTQKSKDNCGACGTACSGGETCQSGTCQCPSGQTLCSGTCVDLENDAKNCGTCGTACSSEQDCQAGKCQAFWARSVGGLTSKSQEVGEAIAVDSNGNIYVAALFRRSITIGSTTHTSNGQGLLVMKLNSSFAVQWSAVASFAEQSPGNLAIDSKGNVVVTGYFTGSGEFGSTTLTSQSRDVYVAKLDSKGAWLWAKKAGGTSSDYSYDVAIDKNDAIYLTGNFSNAANFGSIAVSGQGTEVFVAKLDSQGNWMWVKSAEGSSSDYGRAIGLDGSGNIYVAGYFRSNITFGSTTLTHSGNNNVFVAKMDAQGNWVWASGTKGNGYKYPNSLAVNNAGNVVVTGYFFRGAAEFNTFSIANKGSNDIFVAGLDTNGAWKWAIGAGGSRSDLAYDVTLDQSGSTYVAGFFQGTTAFGTLTLTAKGSVDAFVGKINSSGRWSQVQSYGGTESSHGRAIAIDSSENMYLTGYLSGSLAFGSLTLTSKGDWDMFVAKFDKTGATSQAISAGGKSSDTENSYGIATDKNGASYIVGSFQGEATFGSTTLTAIKDSQDMFVAKIDKDGKWLWAKQAGSEGTDRGYGVFVDSSGNAYVTGYFEQSATFGSTTLTSKGSRDGFVARLDNTGSWLWVKQLGSSSSDYGYSVAADSSGNTYLTGSFYSSTNFGTTTLSSKGNNDIFVAQLDSKGNWVWVVQAGGSNTDTGRSIALDSSGNAYITGDIAGAVTFGTLTLSANSGRRGRGDLFVAKLDNKGNWLWAKHTGSSSYSDVGTGIAVDGKGNAYLTGYFAGSVDFGSTKLSSTDGSTDLFVAKMDKDGNWLWANYAGGEDDEYGYGIAIDSSGNSYITGQVYATIVVGNNILSSPSNDYGIFVAKLDPNGKWAWAKITSTQIPDSDDEGRSIATDNSGNVYVTGHFRNTVTLGKSTLHALGDQDIFVWKLKQ